MNRLHWHLTEDQGWRIEIKKYPKLTEIGAYRDETMVGKNWNEYDGGVRIGFMREQSLHATGTCGENQFGYIVRYGH
uniref:beta-N-acetylhexosaminidase n=1 Tax=uncultured prokaryote TaxID=198431 RepID=A0A0H5Q1J3_9ZZZZ|nr:hypothetical protein [uncultured prokaryote]